MEYSFGTWIKRRRKALDLTQQQLAQEIGCSPSLIFKIESDERRPSRQMAELLAEKLDSPPEQRPNFLKTARQEKSIASLETIPPLSGIEPAPALKQNPGNLPVSPTPLVGREHELNVITKQLLDIIEGCACRQGVAYGDIFRRIGTVVGYHDRIGQVPAFDDRINIVTLGHG